ncbi:hypothetical protein GG851_25555 [Bordetella petrii]|nr:hypothetical protein [Bordetella petrii]
MATISLGPEERWVQNLIMKIEGDVIGQNDPTEEQIARGEISKEFFLSEENKLWLSPFIKNLLSRGDVSKGDYFDYVQGHFKKFYTIPEWRNHIKSNYGFCFGTRFHGNMIALQSGVQALWLVHDMRTKELCDHLNLPSTSIEYVGSDTEVQDLYDKCDYRKFWQNMPKRTREFVNYLSGNGVSDLMDEGIVEIFDRLISKKYGMA